MKARWLVSCSCGWHTDTSEEWSARSAAKIDTQVGRSDMQHVVSVEQPQQDASAADGPAPLD